MKKRMLAFAMALVFAAAGTAGCSSSKKSEDADGNGYADEIYLYNWSEYMIPEILEDFEKEYGIKVVETIYESNDEMLAKLLNSSEGEYDIAVPTNYFVKAMLENDLLEEFDKAAITNLDNIYDNYLDLDYDKGNKYTVPYMAMVTVGVGNKKRLQNLGVDIDKAVDLLQPELKDEVIVIDDNEEIMNIALMGSELDPKDKSVGNLKKSKDYLLDLNKNLKAYAQTADGRTMLARGEVAFSYMYSGDAIQAMNENKDLEIVMNEEKLPLSIDTFVLIKGTKHKKEAQLFIDFVLRPENYAKLVEEFYYACINEAAVGKLSKELAQNPACVLDEDMLERSYIVGDKTEEMLAVTSDIVTEVKSAK